MAFAINQRMCWIGLIALSFLFSFPSYAAPRLAFQVYAVRDICAKDFVGTLRATKAVHGEKTWKTDEVFLKSVADGVVFDVDPARAPIYAIEKYFDKLRNEGYSKK